MGVAFGGRHPHTGPMSNGKDNGKSPASRPSGVKPLGKPATITTKGMDLSEDRPRAPRPPGKPVAIVKKGIG